MTPQEFDRATARMPKLAAHNREAARRVLVDGERVIDVAAAYGMPHARLSRTTAAVVASWASHRREPVEWVTVTLTVPAKLAKRMRKMAQEARRALPRRERGRPIVEAPSVPPVAPQEAPMAAPTVDVKALIEATMKQLRG